MIPRSFKANLWFRLVINSCTTLELLLKMRISSTYTEMNVECWEVFLMKSDWFDLVDWKPKIIRALCNFSNQAFEAYLRP